MNKRSTTLTIRVGNVIPARKLRSLPTDADRIDYLRRKTYILSNRKDPPAPPPLIARFAKRPGAPPAELISPTPRELMVQEVATLAGEAELAIQGDYTVFISGANQIPNIVREIGRLRELTFRATGEGTGRSTDLDSFDSYYLHLFIWNHTRSEIVGAYRLAQSDRVLRNFGRRGLYTSTLFSCKRAFLERLSPALELGRSFVRIEDQKSYAALLLLWR